MVPAMPRPRGRPVRRTLSWTRTAAPEAGRDCRSALFRALPCQERRLPRKSAPDDQSRRRLGREPQRRAGQVRRKRLGQEPRRLPSREGMQWLGRRLWPRVWGCRLPRDRERRRWRPGWAVPGHPGPCSPPPRSPPSRRKRPLRRRRLQNDPPWSAPARRLPARRYPPRRHPLRKRPIRRRRLHNDPPRSAPGRSLPPRRHPPREPLPRRSLRCPPSRAGHRQW